MLVSIITPLAPDRYDHLQELSQSIRRSRIPHDASIEWLIQVDGPIGQELDEILSSIQQECVHDGITMIPESHHYPGGAAVARNLAASRSQGDVLIMIDADDLIKADFISQVIGVIEDEEVDFVYVLAEEYIVSENKIVPPEQKPGWETGKITPGSLRDAFYHKTVHFPAAPITVRSNVFWSVGGYSALMSNEDTNLLVKLDDDHQGYLIAQPLYIYRRWDKQHTTEEVFLNEELAEQRRRINLKMAGM